MAWEVPFIMCADFISAIDDVLGDNAFTARNSGGIQDVFGRRSVTLNDGNYLRREVPDLTELIIGERMHTTDTVGTGIICQLLNSSGQEIINLNINASARIEVRTGATVLGTSSVVLSPLVNFMYEFGVVLHGSTGIFKLWLDGTLVASDTNVDTINNAGPCRTVEFRGNLNALNPTTRRYEWYIDESDTSLVPFGSGRVFVSRSTTDDAPNQFTPSTGTNHAAMVDEDKQDGDTTYLESTAAAQVEAFKGQSLATIGASGTIKVVTRFSVCKRPAPGSGLEELGIDSNGTVDYSDPRAPIDAGYRTLMGKGYKLNPDGNVPWTDTAFNDLRRLSRSA